MNIVLASQSPRRRELLELMGLDFTVRAADIDETMNPDLDIREELARVSMAKAMAVPVGQDDLVIAADTIVVCDNHVLGKPHSVSQAKQMLSMLSGREHEVYTGLAVRMGDRAESRIVRSHVEFRPLSEAEIDAYIATGEPMDKAGAYGIQGKAALLIRGIRGDYYNVMGLPVCALTECLRGFGVKILGE